jgi:hypothetical protein
VEEEEEGQSSVDDGADGDNDIIDKKGPVFRWVAPEYSAATLACVAASR